MSLNIEEELWAKLHLLSKAPWVQRGIRYLGIKLSDNPSDLLIDNILPFKNNLRNMLSSWQKFRISWLGRLAVIKMKILPVLLFLFKNLIIHIPVKNIDEFQGVLNRFLWKNKKPWVKIILLQQKIIGGGGAWHTLQYGNTTRTLD